MLNERSQSVLKAIVKSYTERPEPVGSRFLTKRFDFSLSPATIRNIMADLEEAGYLWQPHTSAGRVPTDRGFRFFVDHINLKARKSEAERYMEAMKNRFRNIRDDINTLLSEATSMLSDRASCMAFAVPLRPTNTTLNRVQLYRYKGSRIVALIVTNEGLITNKLLESDFGLSQRDLDRISEYLNSEFAGHTINEIRLAIVGQMSQEKSICDILITRAVRLCEEALNFQGSEMIVAGLPELIALPEFVHKIDRVTRALEDRTKILRILEGVATYSENGVAVIIGAENPDKNLRELSIISAEYRQGDRPLGRVGMIGPTRMDYEKAIPLVEVVARYVSSSIAV